jgi:PAS domain S-box-containing protein
MLSKKNVLVERLMLLGFGLTLGVLLLVAGIAWNIAAPMAPSSSVDHTRDVMATLDKLRGFTDRAEKYQQRYFLTQEKSALVQRDDALRLLQMSVQQLLALTDDNSLQQQRILKLQTAVNERIRVLDANQAAFEHQGNKVVRALISEGDDASSEVRSVTEAAFQEEQTLLATRKANETLLLRIIIASVLVLLVFLVPLTVRIRRVVRSRLADDLALEVVREALIKSGALQDAIFNSANFSSIATDAQGVIQIFNVGAERMLGYKAEEVVDKVTPAGISDAQELVVRAAALSHELGTPITPGFDALVFKASRGIEDIYELTYIRKDGSRFPAIVSVTALRDEQGKVIGYLLIGTDNTARKQVEAEQALLDQRLRDQQFYTRSLIESNIDALMTTDPRGIISDVNQQMEVLTGCTRDELIGAPFKNFFTDPLRAEAAITRVLREGKVTNYELTAHARGGTQTVVSYNATTFHDRDRKLQGVFASARDITDRKQFELALEVNNLELEAATAAAEKANRAKSDFLSSMSHELRTPLNAILGFTQLLESGTPVPTASQQRSIHQILKAGWYLLELINEVLDLALIESGRLTLSTEPVALLEVMLECQTMIEPQAQQRGIGMTFARAKEPYFVLADRTRVKQILINILFNAIKYNKVGGLVVVEYVQKSPGVVRISVRDTGAGLSPEQLGHLFQPFNRLGQEASTEEGTGIGLVVTKQLVELMGGTIGADSVVGEGSVFWFELNLTTPPILDVLQVEHASEVPLPTPGGAMHTLLYVEDNPANLELVEQIIMRRTDLRLISATDGTIGIGFARAYQPEVILMDINLPGISGIEAMRILRADPKTAHIPVIAVSANAIPGDIEKGINSGFFSYVTKPIQVSQFMTALNAALVFSQTTAAAAVKEETP